MNRFSTHTMRISGLLVFLMFVVPYPVFADVFDSVGLEILRFAAFFTGLGGLGLDYAVNDFVIGMGEWFSVGGGETALSRAVDQTWSVVRDLMNIAFVFGLIYLGMQLILDINSQTSQIKRTLGLIIIGALLVNFSLFFAKFVIDVANVAATEIYDQATPTIQTVSVGGTDSRQGGISEGFMHLMGLQSFYDGSTRSIDEIYGEDGLSLMYVLTGVVFLLIAAFVFAAGFLLLIIRFVVLVFLMVVSPIAFGALAFPQTQKYALDWWHLLFSQAFFAPAFLFLAYVSLLVINGMDINSGATPFAQVATASSLDISVVAAFALASAFLIGSLILAKYMGVKGAESSIKLGNIALGRAKGGANYLRRTGQGLALRNTAGRFAGRSRRAYERLDQRLPSGKWARRGRMALNTLTLGALSDTAIRDSLTAAEQAKYGGYKNLKDDAERDKRVEGIRSNVRREREREAEIEKVTSAAASGTTLSSGDVKNIQRMTLDELSKMKEKELKLIAQYLTTKQVDQISDAKPEVFTDTQKADIRSERESAQQTVFNTYKTSGNVDKYFSEKKAEDAAKLPKEILTDAAAAAAFTPELLVALEKTLTIKEREVIANQIEVNSSHPAHKWLTTTPRGALFTSNV